MPDSDHTILHESRSIVTDERIHIPGEEIAPLASSPKDFPFHKIFIGTDGLRAGWSLLIYLAMLAVLMIGTGRVVHAWRHRGDASNPSATAQASNPSTTTDSDQMPINTTLITEGISLFAVTVATWLMGKIERRPYSTYGLGGRRRLPSFVAGLGWGLAMLSFLVFTLRATGLLVFDARLLFGGSTVGYGLGWFAAFMLVGLFEECLFRGYLQFTLARGIQGFYDWIRAFGPRENGQRPNAQQAPGFWIAAVLVSFGFGFVHHTNSGESPIGMLSAGLISVVFCLSLWRTGSLWWAIGFHAAWDWAQSFLYGVADSGTMVQHHLFGTHPLGQPIYSGGLTGPEGSIYILPILALSGVAIMLTLPDSQHDLATSVDQRVLQ